MYYVLDRDPSKGEPTVLDVCETEDRAVWAAKDLGTATVVAVIREPEGLVVIWPEDPETRR